MNAVPFTEPNGATVYVHHENWCFIRPVVGPVGMGKTEIVGMNGSQMVHESIDVVMAKLVKP